MRLPFTLFRNARGQNHDRGDATARNSMTAALKPGQLNTLIDEPQPIMDS
jgi:hypothetical protein